VDVEGGVSLSELADLTCPCLLRARAVSLRASSSVFVGLEPSDMEIVEGIILPINDHRLLLVAAGAYSVSVGMEVSVVLVLETAAREWRLLAGGWVVPDWDGMMPSRPKKRLEEGEWSSPRMMRRRRPGAG
jgi:hypothetical protein